MAGQRPPQEPKPVDPLTSALDQLLASPPERQKNIRVDETSGTEPVPGSEVGPLEPIQGRTAPDLNELLDRAARGFGEDEARSVVGESRTAPEGVSPRVPGEARTAPLSEPAPTAPTSPPVQEEPEEEGGGIGAKLNSLLEDLSKMDPVEALVKASPVGVVAGLAEPDVGKDPLEAARTDFTERLKSATNALAQGAAGSAAGLTEYTSGILGSQIQQNVFESQGIDPGLAMRPEEFPGYQAGEQLRKGSEKYLPINPAYKDDFFTTTVAKGAGTTFLFLATGTIGAMAGLPAFMSAGATGFLANGAEAYREAVDAGATLEEALKASNFNAFVGISEGAPIASFLGKLDRGTGGSVRKAIKDIILQGTEEGLQEGIQQIASNLIASDIVEYDPDRGVFTGVGEGAGAGFTIGGLMATLGALALGGKRLRLRPEDREAPTSTPEGGPRPQRGELFPPEEFGIRPPPPVGPGGQLELPGIPPAPSPSEFGIPTDVGPRQLDFFDSAAATTEQNFNLPFEERFDTPYASGLVVARNGETIDDALADKAGLLSLKQAEREVANLPPQGAKIYQIDLQSLEKDQVTAGIAALPKTLDARDKNVYFAKGTSKADQAEAKLKLNNAISSLGRGETQRAIDEYEEALNLGLRYRPQPFGDIKVIGRVGPGQFKELPYLPSVGETAEVFMPLTLFNKTNIPGISQSVYSWPARVELQREAEEGKSTGPYYQLKADAVEKADLTFVEPPGVDTFEIIIKGYRGKDGAKGLFSLEETIERLDRYGVVFKEGPGYNIERAIDALEKKDWTKAINLGVRFVQKPRRDWAEKYVPQIALGEITPRDLVEVAPLPWFGRDNPYNIHNTAPDGGSLLGLLRSKGPELFRVSQVVAHLQQGAGLKTLDGKEIEDVTDTGMVTVMGWGDTNDLSYPATRRKRVRFERFLRRTAKQYERLMKAFGLEGQKIFILPQDPAGERDAGYYIGNPHHGLHVIHISESSRDPADWASTAFHEFGHFLTMTVMARADASTIAALQGAFRRLSLQYSRMTKRDFAKRMRSPSRFIDASTFDSVGGDYYFGRWWDFDEWIAEQTVRWMTTSTRAVTLVDRFFKRLSSLMLKAAKQIIGVTDETLLAETEFDNFMNSALDRPRNGLPPISYDAANAAIAASKAENMPATELYYNVPRAQAPSGQGASHNSKQAAEHGLLEFGDYSKDEFKANMDWYNRLIGLTVNVIQLAQKNRHLSGLQRFVEGLDLSYGFKMRILSKADKRVSEWVNTIPVRERKAFDRFLFDLTEMKYLKDDKTGPRLPTPWEELELAKKHGLNEKHVAFSRLIRQDFNTFLDTMEDAFIGQARETFIENQEGLSREIATIQSEFNELRKRPYIPMMRFGKYTIDVVDKDTGERLFFETVESERVQKRRARLVRQQFPNAFVDTGVLSEQIQPMQGLPPQMIKAIVSMKISGLTETQQKELEQLAFQYSPAKSFSKRLLRRKELPGYSDDALRGYTSYFFHGANYLMRMKYRSQLQGAINQVKSSARELARRANDEPGITESQINKRGEIANFLQRQLEDFLNPTADWANVRAFAFNYHLGFALDSAALNLTQVPMVAFPFLASRFSDTKAAAELSRAYKDVHGIYKASAMNPKRLAGVSEEEFRALQRAMEEGFIDEGQATALASLAEGSRLQRVLPGTPIGRFFRQASHWSGFFFQQAEMLNRRVVFRAGYRLALANPDAEYLNELAETKVQELTTLLRDGFSRREALAYMAGKYAVRGSQYEYARYARPRFMRGKWATLFTFFNFLQNTLFFARYDPGAARYLLILAGTAGLMGLPGMEDLFDISDWAYRQLAKRGYVGGSGSLEKEIREFLVELGANPDLILHGISSKSYGLTQVGDAIGLPIPSVDFSQRVGVGRVVPGVEALTSIDTGTFEEVFGKVTEDVAGAAYSIPITMIKALTDNHPDVFKRYSRTLPRAFRNVHSAWTMYAEEGVENRAGANILPLDPKDPDDMAEIIAKALGFNPTRVSKRWDAQRLQQEIAMFWTTRKTMLMMQWDYARRQGDREATADVMKGVRQYNKDVPWPSMRIGAKNLRSSLIGRMRRRMLDERGLLHQRSLIPMSNDVLDLFPDLKRDLESNRQMQLDQGLGEVVDEEEVR